MKIAVTCRGPKWIIRNSGSGDDGGVCGATTCCIFYCQMEHWHDCDELRPTLKEKLTERRNKVNIRLSGEFFAEPTGVGDVQEKWEHANPSSLQRSRVDGNGI